MSSNENAIVNEHVFIDVAVVFPKLYIIWVTEQAPLFKVVPYHFLILVNMEFRYVFLDNYYSSKNNKCMFSIKHDLRSQKF